MVWMEHEFTGQTDSAFSSVRICVLMTSSVHVVQCHSSAGAEPGSERGIAHFASLHGQFNAWAAAWTGVYIPHSRLNFIDPRDGAGLQSGSPQRQGPLTRQGLAVGKHPLLGRVPSHRTVAGSGQDWSSGGSTAEVQKVWAKPTLAGPETTKTRDPSGAIGCSPGSVPMALHGAVSQCLPSVRWTCPAQPVCSILWPWGSERMAGGALMLPVPLTRPCCCHLLQ